jgi:hypothetical protein
MYVCVIDNDRIFIRSPEYFQGLWGDRNTANFDGMIRTFSRVLKITTY